MLREKCNRPMLLVERQKAMLLEVYKCIYELGPRYRHGMFSFCGTPTLQFQKSQ